jgi:hypothetical protein
MPPRETLATASSRPNIEALATCVVLAHPHTAFLPCMCGLCRDAVAVAVALIDYDHEEEMIVIDYFLYTNARLCWIATPTFLPLLSASSANDNL